MTEILRERQFSQSSFFWLLYVSATLLGCGAASDFKRALKLEEEGKLKEAISVYQGIQYRCPEKWGEAEAKIAGLLLQQGDSDGALSKYMGISTTTASVALIATINEGMAKAYLARADAYKKRGSLNKAIGEYSRVVAMNPSPELTATGKAAIVECQKVLQEKARKDSLQACEDAYQDAVLGQTVFTSPALRRRFGGVIEAAAAMCSSVLNCAQLCNNAARCYDVLKPNPRFVGISLDRCKELVNTY